MFVLNILCSPNNDSTAGFSAISIKARLVRAVTNTECPSAHNFAHSSAIIYVLPVPGGPSKIIVSVNAICEYTKPATSSCLIGIGSQSFAW